MTYTLKVPTDFTLTVNLVGPPPAGLADALNALEIKMSQVSDKLAEIQTAVEATAKRVSDHVGQLIAEVDALKAKVGAGESVSAADFSTMDTILNELNGVDAPKPGNPTDPTAVPPAPATPPAA